MASLFLSLGTITGAGTTSFQGSLSNTRSPVPLVRNGNRRFRRSKVSCASANGDPNSDSDPTSGAPETSLGNFDRRNMLLGLGGLYAATGGAGFAFGAPIQAPDLTKCDEADVPEGVTPTNCCPPPSSKIKDFRLPPPSSPMRTRPASHLTSNEYIAKYKKAIELMKGLPDEDPRSFTQQANVHCTYCNGAYDQVNHPDLEIQVHNSWLFFPWHRYYIYFHERILAKLIGDPTFALPYWSWDTPDAMRMPAFYADSTSPLYDAKRNPNHLPPTLIDLDYDFTEPTGTEAETITDNLSIMYRQVVSGATSPRLFFGSPYRAGDESDPGGGTVENVPHGPVHIWCGLFDTPGENMGNFYTAGRDPIFFGHHSNIDRMWVLWKDAVGGPRRKDPKDPDWLNASFIFYDENADPVRVMVKDCLDPFKLRYQYQDIPIPWLKSRPTPKPRRTAKSSKAGVAKAAELPKISSTSDFPITLSSVFRVEVPRPKKSRSQDEKEKEEEVLLIKGIEAKKDKCVKFDVFINDEDYSVSRPCNTELVGSYVNVPHKHREMRMMTKTNLRLAINEILEDLGAEDDDAVIVTLVPRVGADDVTIDGVEIEFVSD